MGYYHQLLCEKKFKKSIVQGDVLLKKVLFLWLPLVLDQPDDCVSHFHVWILRSRMNYNQSTVHR